MSTSTSRQEQTMSQEPRKYDEEPFIEAVKFWTIVFIISMIYLLGFFWQQSTIVPHEYLDPENTAWWKGFFHGFFVPLNLFWNEGGEESASTIFQTGGRGAYQFWFFTGTASYAIGAWEIAGSNSRL